MWNVDFDKTPFLVIWETTQACDLACKHCRASAIPGPIPGELTTEEGKRIIEQTAAMGTPLIVLSGGDPAKRADLFNLVTFAKNQNLRVATIPAATPSLNFELVCKLKNAGLDQIAFSLDFPQAELHDAFRGVAGAFSQTMEAVKWAHRCKLPVQINTCLWSESIRYLEEMVALIEKLEIVFWEVFFLVPTGRGKDIQGLTAEDCENAFQTLAQVQSKRKFILKVTEAPHYRRFLHQRHERELGRVSHSTNKHENGIKLAERGVNAGNGFVFISHFGDVFPSGFLPISAGNIRKQNLADIYRNSTLFTDLRNPDWLKGRCGVCPFKSLCGGSRSRAFALTGDWLESDPWCAYQPTGRKEKSSIS